MKITDEMNKKKICGVISQIDGEVEDVAFEKEQVELKKEYNVETWLKKLEDVIKRNLQSKLASFLSKFSEQKANIENRIEGGNKGNNL